MLTTTTAAHQAAVSFVTKGDDSVLNVAWIKGQLLQIAGIIILIVAIGMLFRSNKAKTSDHASTALNVVIAGFIGIGGFLLFKFGGTLADHLFT